MGGPLSRPAAHRGEDLALERALGGWAPDDALDLVVPAERRHEPDRAARGDEPAIDEHKRDEIVEAFETRGVGTGPETDDDVVEEEEELEPDPEQDDY